MARVRLRAFEGEPAQTAELIEVTPTVVTVRVVPQDADDDGLREVTPDQIIGGLRCLRPEA